MSKFYVIVFRCGTLELNLRLWVEMVEFKFEFCIQFSFFFFRPYSLVLLSSLFCPPCFLQMEF